MQKAGRDTLVESFRGCLIRAGHLSCLELDLFHCAHLIPGFVGTPSACVVAEVILKMNVEAGVSSKSWI